MLVKPTARPHSTKHSSKLCSGSNGCPHACSGTPLETKTRRAMYPVLYTQIFNWAGQVGVVSEFLTSISFMYVKDCHGMTLFFLPIVTHTCHTYLRPAHLQDASAVPLWSYHSTTPLCFCSCITATSCLGQQAFLLASYQKLAPMLVLL